MFFPFFDPTMIIVIPGLLLAIYAQFKVKSAFYHYSRVPSQRGVTGAQAAGEILRSQGLDFAVLFQLVTLPVEFNASHRAVALLEDNSFIMSSEVAGTQKVLKAAALTYVAALLVSLLQLLRLLIISGVLRNNDN